MNTWFSVGREGDIQSVKEELDRINCQLSATREGGDHWTITVLRGGGG